MTESEETRDLDVSEVQRLTNTIWPQIAGLDPRVQMVVLSELVQCWIILTMPKRGWKRLLAAFTETTGEGIEETAADMIEAGTKLPTEMPKLSQDTNTMSDQTTPPPEQDTTDKGRFLTQVRDLSLFFRSVLIMHSPEVREALLADLVAAHTACYLTEEHRKEAFANHITKVGKSLAIYVNVRTMLDAMEGIEPTPFKPQDLVWLSTQGVQKPVKGTVLMASGRALCVSTDGNHLDTTPKGNDVEGNLPLLKMADDTYMLIDPTQPDIHILVTPRDADDNNSTVQ